MITRLEAFIEDNMKKGNRVVAARLQTALALLEKLRESPSLCLDDHLASKGSSGIESHETFGNKAHERWKIEPLNKNHGRRSSNLQDWGQSLLDILCDAGFAKRAAKPRGDLIDQAQEVFALRLKNILEQEPLEVRIRGRSAEATIRDILKQAEEKGKSGEVAQYLVGAKLSLRLDREMPVYPANKADRKSRSDRKPRLGDFEVENAVIEVAVGLPDAKHIAQVSEALAGAEVEVWLLTRADRVATWKNELNDTDDIDVGRVIVASVEAFVGQNVTELGGFSIKGKMSQLQALFDLYNSRWISRVGTPGIRIAVK